MKTRSDKKRRKLFGFLDQEEIEQVMRTLGFKPARKPLVQEVIDELREHPYIRAVQEELIDTAEPVPLGERKTMHGYPVGKAVDAPGWRVEFTTDAYFKLMEWDKRRRGLELSGYALLAERPQAEIDEEYVFVIDDILLICAIEESSGGYTEMSPQQRVQGMMWAREKGRSANCLVWWHIHPITGWSGIDVNTLRQRVHETGLDETLSTFSFVLTPTGIRARWDQANPNTFVDQIPVSVPVIEEAAVAVEELFHSLAPGDQGFLFYDGLERYEAPTPTDPHMDGYWYTDEQDFFYAEEPDWDRLAEEERQATGGQGTALPRIIVHNAQGIVEDPQEEKEEEAK